MNYQKLLLQKYVSEQKESETVRIIENPYDIESCKKKTANSSYDLSVLNTTIPAQEIVEMVQNAARFAEKNKEKQQRKNILLL